MSKKLLLLLALAVLLGVSVFYVWKQSTVVAPTTHEPMVMPEPTPEPVAPVEYSQHIEIIPGNTDEVWYNIPEWGVRMKLNKGFAEELIYSDGMMDDFGKSQDGIYFSTKNITQVASECGPKRGGAFGVLYKRNGIAKEDAKDDFLLERDLQDRVVQFNGFYVGYAGPQALCAFIDHIDDFNTLWPKNYQYGQ
ncbi:MAG: hypothetical protein E6R05_04220 [Candidatus Moraniibacteriota bacterium]|nr:MAG: hypothetical protein E6R05_04220 [Candidatus Moranbacteria bacterium]